MGRSDPIWPEQAKQYQAQGALRFSQTFYEQILYPCGLVTLRDGRQKKAGRAASSVTFHSLRHTFKKLLFASGRFEGEHTEKRLAWGYCQVTPIYGIWDGEKLVMFEAAAIPNDRQDGDGSSSGLARDSWNFPHAISPDVHARHRVGDFHGRKAVRG